MSELLRDGHGVVPVPALAHAVLQHTGGNPLFVSQVKQLLGDEQRAAIEAGMPHASAEHPVPGAIVAVLEQRVAQLAPATRQLLEVAAALGQRMSRERLSVLLQWDTAQLAGALQEATDAGLLVADRERSGELRFSHALFQQALLRPLGESHRCELHAQIAAHMQQSGEGSFSAGVLAVGGSLTPAVEARARFGSARAALMLPASKTAAVSDLVAAFDYFSHAGDAELAIAAATCHVDFTWSPELAV